MAAEITSENFFGRSCEVTLYLATGNTIPYTNATTISLGTKTIPFTYTGSSAQEYGVFSCFFSGFNKTCITSQVTLPDGDGNVYKTIKIGNQIWMSENLKTTRFRDGTPLDNPGNTHVSNAIWSGATGPTTRYWSWVNGVSGNTATYGLLYNQFAVTGTTDSTAICPTGWRVPTISELQTLVTYAGSLGVSGSVLRSTTLWSNDSSASTNITGFNWLPTGNRQVAGTYGNFSFNRYGTIWSITLQKFIYADGVGNNVNTTSNADSRTGFSIRCIKN
jgi:uncharacterized protein (TIGR02145 family)